MKTIVETNERGRQMYGKHTHYAKKCLDKKTTNNAVMIMMIIMKMEIIIITFNICFYADLTAHKPIMKPTQRPI
jgi:hypothetical protein